MQFQKNISLKNHSTMRLGGSAKFLCEVSSKEELKEACKWAKDKGLKILAIGEGSNIIWGDKGFDGLIIVNKIMGFEIIENAHELVKVGAGENWDNTVERTVNLGFSGLEFLSLIPGTAGATPIQNVGAYGREISDILETAELYDIQKGIFETKDRSWFNFSYRSSRLNHLEKDRFIIASITLKISKTNPTPPFYASLQRYLDQQNIRSYTPKVIRDAVIAIRSSKLPDPAKVANTGSFFSNPIIDEQKFAGLKEKYPNIPCWKMSDDGIKLSAAWLMDKAGFTDFHDDKTGMGTWPKQTLVLVNEHATSTTDLLNFKQKVISKVHEMFGITLEQEPEFIG